MGQSESIKDLAIALCKAQSKMSGAKKSSRNPFFKSAYPDLASVWEAARAPLTDNGLCITQTMDATQELGVCLITTMMHVSGQWVSGRLPVNPKTQDPQGVGSAITYARRYALMAIVGICPEDDDGEKAMGRGVRAADTEKPEALIETIQSMIGHLPNEQTKKNAQTKLNQAGLDGAKLLVLRNRVQTAIGRPA